FMVPTVEVVAAGGWICGVWRMPLRVAVFAMMLTVFSVVAVHLVLNERPTCACFGLIDAYMRKQADSRAGVWMSATLALAVFPWASLLQGRGATGLRSSK
ncbi:MAG: MauE/DoxX family redox-associated membrane protein, partial [Phycisphaerales bacterium]